MSRDGTGGPPDGPREERSDADAAAPRPDDPGPRARDRLGERTADQDRDAGVRDPASLLDRAFPGAPAGDVPTGEPATATEHGPPAPVDEQARQATFDRARDLHPSLARGRLMTLGVDAAHDGNWDRVDEVVEALRDHGGGAQDQLRTEAVHRALEQGQSAAARRFAEALNDDWTRQVWSDRIEQVEAAGDRPARERPTDARPPDDTPHG